MKRRRKRRKKEKKKKKKKEKKEKEKEECTAPKPSKRFYSLFLPCAAPEPHQKQAAPSN